MIARLTRRLVLAGVFGAAVFAGPVTPVMADEFTTEQKAAIEQLVRDYILKNPEIVQEALINLEEKRKNDEIAARAATVNSMQDMLFSSTRQVTIGNPDAPITVVEFFDYNCGYCKRALGDNLALLANKDVKLVLKEMPILGPQSVEAARVAIAVNMVTPERYLDFHQQLLTGNGPADERRAMAVVDDLGIDAEAVRAAMADPEIGNTIEEVYTLANRLGLSGTPTYVIGDEVLFGAVGIKALSDKVAEMRSCGKATC
jgi:protein-disulfide isomerase